MKFKDLTVGDTFLVTQNESEWLVQKTENLYRPDYSIWESEFEELARYNAKTLTNPPTYILVGDDCEIEPYNFSSCF